MPHLLSRRPIDAIAEREIDLLLLMALHASGGFRAFMTGMTAGAGDHEFLGAWRSVFDQTGETDLLLLLRAPDGARVAVLIEDKIDAAFQPDQAARYRIRGERGCPDNWDRFVTVLCAPAERVEPVRGAWDATLTYEAIADDLDRRADSFAPFVAGALRDAVSKHRLGSFIADEHATGFWAKYGLLQRTEFPALRMTPLSEVRSRNDPWPRFAAGTLPPSIKLEHKAWKGCVDMTFSGVAYGELRARLDGMLPEGFEICRTPPSSAVRVSVKSILSAEPFAPQADAARSAFRAIEALLGAWPLFRAAAGFAPRTERAALPTQAVSELDSLRAR